MCQVRLNYDLLVLASQLARQAGWDAGIIERSFADAILAGEGDGIGSDRLGRGPAHHGDDAGRIQASA
jgi:hypothetical protein